MKKLLYFSLSTYLARENALNISHRQNRGKVIFIQCRFLLFAPDAAFKIRFTF